MKLVPKGDCLLQPFPKDNCGQQFDECLPLISSLYILFFPFVLTATVPALECLGGRKRGGCGACLEGETNCLLVALRIREPVKVLEVRG